MNDYVIASIVGGSREEFSVGANFLVHVVGEFTATISLRSSSLYRSEVDVRQTYRRALISKHSIECLPYTVYTTYYMDQCTLRTTGATHKYEVIILKLRYIIM